MLDIIDAEQRHFPAIRALFKKELSREAIPARERGWRPIIRLVCWRIAMSLVMLDDAGKVVAYAAYHEAPEEVEDLPWKCGGKSGVFPPPAGRP